MLLQLAGIGGQPQQDSTREALSYMMGQQRLAADEADRKVRQSQNEEENRYRMKALEAQVNQKDQGSRMHGLISLVGAARTPEELKFAQAALRSELGLPEMPAGVPEKTYDKDPKLQGSSSGQSTAADILGAVGSGVSTLLRPDQWNWGGIFEDKTPVFNPVQEQKVQAEKDKAQQFQAALQWMAENSGVAPRDTSLDYLLKPTTQYTGQASPVRQPKL